MRLGSKRSLLLALLVACSSATTSPHEDASSPPPHGDAGRVDARGAAHTDAAEASLDAAQDVDDAPSNDAGPVCSQTAIDGTTPPSTTGFLEPPQAITPFYQWGSNNGYCGEVSLVQAGLLAGQWASQYNARLLCGAAGNGADAPVGTALLQSGPNGYCSAHGEAADYNSQVLLEPSAAAPLTTCTANFGLAAASYAAGSNNIGMPGFQDYLAWVKAQFLAGKVVAVGVLIPFGSDSQYDHIVTVTRIGTNHAVTDATYYDDDVLYFEDHGVTGRENGVIALDAPLPPGAGSDTSGCTPYVFGYSFGALAATRASASPPNTQAYSILIPGAPNSQTHTGGDGVGFGPTVTAHNYGVAIGGTSASSGTLPVALRITATTTSGAPNPPSPLAGYDYENPPAGVTQDGADCSNNPPVSWMTMTFELTVSGLTSGTAYNLYEYDFASVSGVGSAAALAIPASSFNSRASQATQVTPFLATGATYSAQLVRTSDQVVAFRAVPASAP